ncbi:MAG: LuxR C-terminal-related transcriptional regulator [Thermonemataceae bacterium]
MNKTTTYTLAIVDGRKEVNLSFGQHFFENDRYGTTPEITDSYQALQSLVQKETDLWILDVNLPHMNGTCIAKIIFTPCTSTNVVLTSYTVNKNVLDSLENISTDGVLNRKKLGEEVLTSLEPDNEEDTSHYYQESSIITQSSISLQRDNTYLAKLHILTPAEKRVLYLISNGYTTAQISRKLCNSIYTIKNHRHSICEKLELHGKTNALFTFLMEAKIWLQEELKIIT